MNKVVGRLFDLLALFQLQLTIFYYFLASRTNSHNFQNKNELGTSSAAMFSRYTAIKLSINVIKFFRQVMQMQPVSFPQTAY